MNNFLLNCFLQTNLKCENSTINCVRFIYVWESSVPQNLLAAFLRGTNFGSKSCNLRLKNNSSTAKVGFGPLFSCNFRWNLWFILCFSHDNNNHCYMSDQKSTQPCSSQSQLSVLLLKFHLKEIQLFFHQKIQKPIMINLSKLNFLHSKHKTRHKSVFYLLRLNFRVPEIFWSPRKKKGIKKIGKGRKGKRSLKGFHPSRHSLWMLWAEQHAACSGECCGKGKVTKGGTGGTGRFRRTDWSTLLIATAAPR